MQLRGCSMGARRVAIAVVVATAFAVAAGASDFFGILPAATYDPSVPTLEKVVGFGWGKEITDPEQILAYADALAKAAPTRVRLLQYARSLEGRPLILLVVGSPANIARWDEIQASLARLGDPRSVSASQAEELIRTLPSVVWIQCSVHGDEASGGDAGLALAYHLAAGSSPEIDAILGSAIVVVDPMENPDGRARFVGSTRRARGARPDPEPASAEHVQGWPGGRWSHEMFDLNRDWFVLTHPETLGRVEAMLRYHPTVVADLHEMDAEEGYFFAPPAEPRHPLLAGEERELLELLGRANAAAFDANGLRYWTREIFDEFYPGYGESWPALTGAVGMTFEEASSRGLVWALADGTLLTYAETVQHHLLASYTTCVTVAAHRLRFLHAWYSYRQGAVTEGQRGTVRAYVLPAGGGAVRSAELAEQLARQGIEVFRVTEGKEGISTGSYVVPLDQPLGRLAHALLERGASMGEAFEKEQERRDRKRMPDEVYDLTAWSLPLLWATPAKPLQSLPHGLDLEAIKPGTVLPGTVSGDGRVAFLLPWEGGASAKALARLLRTGVRASVAAKPFTLQGRQFERGTVVIRRAGNGEGLRERLAEVARATGASFVGTDTGYVERGIDLGSTNILALKAPRIAIAWDMPTAPPSAGDLRYALDAYFGYPASVVRTSTLVDADLSHFDVVILPDSWERGGTSYAAVLGEAGIKRLSSWVSEGGVLVAVGGGAGFLTDEKVGLLASKLEKRLGAEPPAGKATGEAKPEPTPASGRPFDYESAIRPAEEEPPLVPGSILRVNLDAESLFAAGFPGGAVDVLVYSRRIFAPLKLDKGTNVGVFSGPDSLVQAGFVLAASREQLPRKAYLMVQETGRGKVVAFSDDPAARGLTRATMLLLADAVFFGPAGQPD
ncbi:MAG TPA: M14 family zinc carboxypeptidase [Thermoanaerobaculaceae bacterium]|nr:M14 family zinc carboxypeptidase [Thermoanaerobaculaceae bacterium]